MYEVIDVLKIGICDDESVVCAQVEDFLIEICGDLNIDVEIKIFLNPLDLIKSLKKFEIFDLLFLDITFPNESDDGITIGEKIRDLTGYNMEICLISWETGFAFRSYDITPLKYLEKPLNIEKIRELINLFMKKRVRLNASLEYKLGHQIAYIDFRNITYIMSENRVIHVFLSNGEMVTFYGKLGEIFARQLSQHRFFQCHVSYVVNYDHVERRKGSVIIMKSGREIPISRKFSDLTKKRLAAFATDSY